MRMPAESEDGRVLTWRKLMYTISSNLVNRPYNRDCCWLIKSNQSSAGGTWTVGGVHSVKLAHNGTGNRFTTHRLLHPIISPDDHELLRKKVPAGQEKFHVAHRCGRGRASIRGEPCCINPFHTVVVEPKVNQDHKGCKYGSAKTCPHKPGM